jgi:hypothetical protein
MAGLQVAPILRGVSFFDCIWKIAFTGLAILKDSLFSGAQSCA